GIKTQREFNAFNQLTSFSKDGVLTQYDYDSLGRRIAKHTEQGQIDFIWDGNQLLGECLNGKYTWYINRPDEFYPVALIKQNSVYYYHLDQLNTPRFVTNQAAEVVWENTANAYGYEDGAQQTREIENTNFYQPIRFQGQYFDQESGFHYNRFRYYCPKQQRFIHQDPIGILGGINHYQYAPNPVNWVDPMGLSCKEGTATILKIGHGKNMHFAIQVNTKFEMTKTHQWGSVRNGLPTRTVVLGYDELEDFADKSIRKVTIKLPDAIAASDLQRQLLREGDMALDRADWDPDKLDTPLYDPVNQSCLTHVFDVLRAGGVEGVPENSSLQDKSVLKFTRDMMNGKVGEKDHSEVVEKFEENKATWKIDSKGRPISVEATLKATYHGKRSSEEKTLQREVGGEDRLVDDDGGHLVGHRFMSDQGEKNLFPQNSNFNRGSYKSMENEWADWTEAGYEVKLKVSLEPPNSTRPTDVISEYEVFDPISNKRIYKKEHSFSNQSGQDFKRISKENINKFRGLK
uniref:RHS repeat-associated core domain-containing protein n=1 Tax=Marinomonas lutimaris TaxID=2846746 RepID=UPI001CA4818C